MEDYPYSDHNSFGPGMVESTQDLDKDKPFESTETITELAVVAATVDRRRIKDITPSIGSAPKVRVYSRLNLDNQAMVLGDSRRKMLHPLGLVSRPAGVDAVDWENMDVDALTAVKPEIPSLAVSSPSYYPVPVDIEPTQDHVGDGGADDGEPPAEAKGPRDPSEMPFLDHLEEFRWALLKSIFSIAFFMIVSWFITDWFYVTITRLAKNAQLPLITTKVMEVLILKLQMSLVMGIVISLPFVFYYVWSFVSPGLYENEKKWVLPLVVASTACFFIGASIAYFVVLPFMLMFLKTFIPEDISAMITIGNFISTLLKFIILFGVIFQMPLVTFALAKIGILKHQYMSKYRKYAIVVIFVIGAVLTPPDPVSQIIMALPLILLYEISILVARFAGRKTVL